MTDSCEHNNEHLAYFFLNFSRRPNLYEVVCISRSSVSNINEFLGKLESVIGRIQEHKAQNLYQRLDEPVTMVICKDKWLLTKENRDHFNLTLKEEQWESIYIYCYFDTAFPLKILGIRNKSNKAWISKGILKSRNRMLFFA
jgi:hypothetical protein